MLYQKQFTRMSPARVLQLAQLIAATRLRGQAPARLKEIEEKILDKMHEDLHVHVQDLISEALDKMHEDLRV